MKIRIWNAYASNNSGSYTIVGSFPSEKTASDVARALGKMVLAHAAWMAANESDRVGSDSPLAAFCRDRGLAWKKGLGLGDDWPHYGDTDSPSVAAFGHQVVVHHDYTVTLPRTFGEFFYQRGGRVDVEHNHAHHPLVVIIDFWWGWTQEARAKMERELPGAVAKLTAEDGPLFAHANPSFAPAWRSAGSGFGEAPLTVAAVFADLVGGTAAVTAVAKELAIGTSVRVIEALGDGDPIAFMRPNSPPR